MSQQDPRLTSSVFTRGAVDLSALRARTQQGAGPGSPSAGSNGGGVPARPRPAAAPTSASAPAGGPAPGGVAIIDVTENTFQSEVIERSRTTPVVVDFWAEWCGPCKQLSPVLEKLATEGGGRWVLAKVNVDTNPRLAQAFRVQSIPTVFAIIGGQPVDAFMGVQPENQLRQWIAALLNAAGQQAPPPPADERIVAAAEALATGNLDRAEELYKKVLAEKPNDTVAEAGIAQVELLRRVAGVDPRQAIATADANPSNIDAQLTAADVELLSGLAPRAYERLIDLVRRTSGEDRDRVRRHLVSLFTIAGPDDPDVAAARRQLANALY